MFELDCSYMSLGGLVCVVQCMSCSVAYSVWIVVYGASSVVCVCVFGRCSTQYL